MVKFGFTRCSLLQSASFQRSSHVPAPLDVSKSARMSQRDVRAAWRSAPGSDLVPRSERDLFVERFEKEAEFFQLFFLLINRSCPIKNVDLVWVERDPSGRVGLRHVGITEALAGHGSRLLGCSRQSPHPAFCNIINDFGRHEAESCSISDTAAEELIRTTGKTQVYRCHFGLVDIAVPVKVNGQHIATLFSGEVLCEPPSQEGFAQITKDVARLDYVDPKQLEQAYWQVPVVSEEDIRNTIEILERFADYIANSWLRLAEAVGERDRKDRELRIAHKEFAYHVLEGEEATRAGLEEMHELARRIGFTRPPNRVLIVRFDTAEEGQVPVGSFDLSLASAQRAIEELCEKLDNVVAAHLRKRGICVFFHDAPTARGRSSEFYAHRLVNRILHAIKECCELPVRIGVGGAKSDWCDLTQSYREACTALAGSSAVVATYRRPQGSFKELSGYSEKISRLLTERKLEEAKSAIGSLPGLVGQSLGSDTEGFASAKLFFSSTLDSLCFTARDLGCDTGHVAALCSAANDDFQRASDVLQLHEIWLRSAAGILEAVRLLYSGKRKKIVERARLMIEHQLQHGASPPSMSTIASALGVSVSHMSRTFKRGTGQTFESYLTTKRVELAKRLLLDPLHNVSHVAQRCGFVDASYFARVFRKIVGCSPTEYCRDPLRCSSLQEASAKDHPERKCATPEPGVC